MDVAGGHREKQRIAPLVADQVELGGESSPRAAESLFGLGFLDRLRFVFFAPAEC